MAGYYLKPKNVQKEREKAERFEVAFNQIHVQLKRLAGNDIREDSFVVLLHKVKERHASIRRYMDDLLSYAKLRNALVHEKKRKDFYIAEPHWEVVENIESIAKFLISPPAALSIASNRVKTYQITEDLKEVLVDMDSYPFTQYPVYDAGEFSYLLTEGGITSYLAKHFVGNLIDFTNETLASIKPFENNHAVKFVPTHYDVFEIEDLFEEYLSNNKKLEAVIVTQNGRKTEKALGIITPWDLIKVERHGSLAI